MNNDDYLDKVECHINRRVEMLENLNMRYRKLLGYIKFLNTEQLNLKNNKEKILAEQIKCQDKELNRDIKSGKIESDELPEYLNEILTIAKSARGVEASKKKTNRDNKPTNSKSIVKEKRLPTNPHKSSSKSTSESNLYFNYKRSFEKTNKTDRTESLKKSTTEIENSGELKIDRYLLKYEI